MPNRTCSFDGCDRPHYGRGLCRSHWKQQRRTGKLGPLRRYEFGGTCTVEGCDRRHSTKGLCALHYDRLTRNGDPLAGVPVQIRGDVAARLASRLVEDENGCLVYAGGYSARSGHKQMWHEGQMRSVHRVAWQLANGPIPDDMCVCHRCDNPPCCNVEHLFLGTVAENNYDRDRKGRGVVPEPGERWRS